MRKIVVSVFCFGLLLSTSCSKKDNMNCSYDPCSVTAPDAEVQQVQSYITTNKVTAVKHCSGVFYQIISEGTGTQPSACSSVSVKYTGTLTNGSVFDQTTTPVSFSLLRLIEGWKKGLPLIKKGGKIKLIIPPSLGYGASANGSIPGNSILIFDIELVDVA